LLLKGFPVSVLGHRNRVPVESLVGQGASESADVAALMAASDIVVLCVTGSPQVEDLVYRAGGILASGRAGQIVIDTSTSLPSSTLRLAQALKEKGIVLVDAPLTRTPVEAEQGRLNTMVGADAATFARSLPGHLDRATLRRIANSIRHEIGERTAQLVGAAKHTDGRNLRNNVMATAAVGARFLNQDVNHFGYIDHIFVQRIAIGLKA
jgi:3-hydroxyisobutyrate dehydrogenase-like beta-hydroxyacid dehydrogenase